MSSSRYIELHARSAFSFLRGACLPEEYVAICSAYAQEGLGAPAMALTDVDGVYGSARFHTAAKKYNIQAHVGAEVTSVDGSRYTLLVESREGYQNLCRLLTRMKLRAARFAAGSQEFNLRTWISRWAEAHNAPVMSP